MATKYSNLFNLDSIEKFLESGNQRGFTDAASGIVLGRMLTHVDPEIFTLKYPDLAFMSAGFTVDNSGGYVQKIQSLQNTAAGSFAKQRDRSDGKGKITLEGRDSTIDVFPWSAESQWSDDEIHEAELQGINLPQRLIEAHNEIYQQTIDKMIADVALDHATWGSYSNDSNFNSKKNNDLYAVFADTLTTQWSNVNNVGSYMANTIITSPAVVNRLNKDLLSVDGHSAMTVMAALKANFPGLQVLASHHASGIGTGNKDVALFVSTSPQVAKIRIPLPLTIGEVVKPTPFTYLVESKFRIGGFDLLQQKGGFILRQV
jgi:hypothetical protein